MAKEFDMSKYSKLFVSEAREALKVSSDALLKLEADPGNRELVDLVFRNCHTIKGMASMMNLKSTADTAHAIEDVLAAVRDGRLEPKGDVADLLFKSLDALDGMVTAVEGGQEPSQDMALVDALRGLLSAAPSAQPQPVAPQPAEKKPEKEMGAGKTLVIKLAKKCSLPAARALVIIKELEKSSTVTETSPTQEDIEREIVFEELTVRFDPGEKYRESLRRIGAMSDVDQMIMGDDSAPREAWERLVTHEQPRSGAPV